MNSKSSTVTKGGVLLLERDADLERNLQTILRTEHYAVFTATNADEACAICRTAAIDLLLVDADSLGRGIGTLLGQLKSMRPALRVVGIRRAPDRAAGTWPAGVNLWVEKPVNWPRLVTALNTLLAALRLESFRLELLQRQMAPFVGTDSYRHWGLNE